MNVLKQVIVALAILLPTMGLCSELPEGYPEAVMHQGRIDELSRAQLSLIIDDMPFVYTPATRTQKPNGRYGSLADLETGMRVGCNYRIDGQHRFVLYDVWILPQGASFPE